MLLVCCATMKPRSARPAFVLFKWGWMRENFIVLWRELELRWNWYCCSYGCRSYTWLNVGQKILKALTLDPFEVVRERASRVCISVESESQRFWQFASVGSKEFYHAGNVFTIKEDQFSKYDFKLQHWSNLTKSRNFLGIAINSFQVLSIIIVKNGFVKVNHINSFRS